MTIALTLAWWHIPTLITTIALLWVIFWPVRDAGWFSDLVRLFMLAPALIVSLLAWAIAGALK